MISKEQLEDSEKRIKSLQAQIEETTDEAAKRDLLEQLKVAEDSHRQLHTAYTQALQQTCLKNMIRRF